MSITTADLADGRGPEEAARETPPQGGVSAALTHGNVNLRWLVQLHWAGLVGQVVAIFAASLWSGVGLPLPTLGVFLMCEVLANFALQAWAGRGRVTDRGVAFVMVADVVVLTVLLDLTGGVSNPFAAIYLVYVALAAVILPARWAWILAAATAVGYGALYVNERVYGRSHHVTMRMRLEELADEYARTAWLAFTVASASIVFFIRRISDALAQRERELEEARARGHRRERLASLATLAAGAAHELATPLSTIAVVAKELDRNLPAGTPDDVREDLRIVRDQVARCRNILDRMSARAGETAGEQIAELTGAQWLAAALDGFPWSSRVSQDASPEALQARVRGPVRALADMLRGLMKNAAQASPEGSPIHVKLSLVGETVHATVKDSGRGMSPEVLRRVGEPFYTTKGPGEGMGLGLFLTRALAEQLGGEFRIASRPGEGTEATVELPAVAAGGRRVP